MRQHRIGLSRNRLSGYVLTGLCYLLRRTTCMSWSGVYYWVSRRYDDQPNAGYVKKWVTWLLYHMLTCYESALSPVMLIAGCSVFLSDHASRKQSTVSPVSNNFHNRVNQIRNVQFVRKQVGFTDKIHSVRQRLSGITVGPTKSAECYEEWDSSELDWVEQP